MGLNVQTSQVFTADPSQRGHVLDQDPEPGTTVNKGDTVTIYVGSA
jgi:beta-lactam-binding protein with PASTA domain